ncbi:ATP-binding protein [Streptomyces sp. NPDC006879]|uniref:ATP-binding protein n=1 Tax=Streptomyces sp. NPDC006879 TaxID=3364767 RepID=UPI003674767A
MKNSKVPAWVARNAVRNLLGSTSSDRLFDMMLVVSELVANAVKHTPGPLGLIIEDSQLETLLAVHDPLVDLGAVHVRTPGGKQEGGRGLLLVDELATSWTIQATRNGKLVAAHFSHPLGALNVNSAPPIQHEIL